MKNGYKIIGKFARLAPSNAPGKPYVPQGWFAVSHRAMAIKETRRRLHGRWFRIQSPNRNIYRILQFNPTLSYSNDSKGKQILIDWMGWLELINYADDVDQELELEISPASPWSFPLRLLSHPDPIYKISYTLGLLSFTLGALSFLIAVR